MKLFSKKNFISMLNVKLFVTLIVEFDYYKSFWSNLMYTIQFNLYFRDPTVNLVHSNQVNQWWLWNSNIRLFIL